MGKTIIRFMIVGMLGGLLGDIVMQLLGVGIFALIGFRLDTSFVTIGDSAASFFTKVGLPMAGGAPFGLLVNILVSLGLGGLWGLLVAISERLRRAATGKALLYAILYVEAMSIPMLLAGSMALGMELKLALLWAGISALMHVVFGSVLAGFVRLSMRTARFQQPPAYRTPG